MSATATAREATAIPTDVQHYLPKHSHESVGVFFLHFFEKEFGNVVKLHYLCSGKKWDTDKEVW